MKTGEIIGFIFIIFGILWSAVDRILCTGFCPSCSVQELFPCFFLFLFVGIIFIVSGASLIITQNQKVKKRKKK